MKRKIYLIIMLLLSNIILFAQSNEKNRNHNRDVKALVIVYDDTYPNLRPKLESTCFKKTVTMIHGSKIVSNTYFESGEISTQLSNDCNRNYYMFYSTVNPNYMIKSNRDSIAPMGGCSVKCTLSGTNQMKTILGYQCKESKLLIDVMCNNTPTSTTSYYYTYDQLKDYNMDYYYKGLKGILLCAESDMTAGVILKQIATSITEQLVDSSIFDIPLNYEAITMAEYVKKITTDIEFKRKTDEALRLEKETSTQNTLEDIPHNKKKQFFKTFFEVLQVVGTVAGELSNIQKQNIISSPNMMINNNQTNTGHMENVECPVCHGTGYSAAKEYPPTFGQDRIIMTPSCRYCGDIYLHSHKNCVNCKGTKLVQKWIQ